MNLDEARERIKALIAETVAAREYFGGRCDAARAEVAAGGSKGTKQRRFDAGADAAALAIREKALRDALACLR